MGANDPRLPGVGRGRRPRGRHRRAFDQFARHARSILDTDPVLEQDLTNLRALADELDRLEIDPDHSAHTFALVNRTFFELRAPITARLATADHVTLADLFADVHDVDTTAP